MTRTPAASVDHYLARTIKRVTLFFSFSEYDGVLNRLAAVRRETGAPSNTAAVLSLLEFYEQNRSRPHGG